MPTKNAKKDIIKRVTIALSDEEYQQVLALRESMKVRTIASTIRECINISNKVQKLKSLEEDIKTEALRNELRNLKEIDDQSSNLEVSK